MSTNIRYLLYVLVVACVLGWYFTSGSADVVATSNPPTKKTPAAKTSGELDADLLKAPPFAKLKIPTRDIFMPALIDDSNTPKTDDGDNKLPAAVAGGDPNWTFTGIAEIDGVKFALLENGSNHESGFVKEGETWKKSKVVRITPDNIAMVGPDGIEETVLRYNPNTKEATAVPQPEAAPQGGPGFQPLQPNLRGLRGRINGGPQIMMGGGGMPVMVDGG